MAGEIRRDEESPSGLQALIGQGFSVVRGLRSEAESANNRVETAQSAESKIINYNKSQIIEVTAERIEKHLNFLQQRLSSFRPDPET